MFLFKDSGFCTLKRFGLVGIIQVFLTIIPLPIHTMLSLSPGNVLQDYNRARNPESNASVIRINYLNCTNDLTAALPLPIFLEMKSRAATPSISDILSD